MALLRGRPAVPRGVRSRAGKKSYPRDLASHLRIRDERRGQEQKAYREEAEGDDEPEAPELHGESVGTRGESVNRAPSRCLVEAAAAQ